MDKEIVKILSSYGCKYMADDYKEMIEEIVNFVKEREQAINFTDSSLLLKDRHKQRFEDYIKIFYVKTGEMYRFKNTQRMSNLNDVFKIFCEREKINL